MNVIYIYIYIYTNIQICIYKIKSKQNVKEIELILYSFISLKTHIPSYIAKSLIEEAYMYIYM